MELLIWTIIAGAATGFTTELLGLLIDRWVDPKVIKLVVTAPLSALYLWLLGVDGLVLIVAALAASFFALMTLWAVNRPIQVQQVLSRGR